MDEARFEHPLSTLSASIEHPLKPGGDHVEKRERKLPKVGKTTGIAFRVMDKIKKNPLLYGREGDDRLSQICNKNDRILFHLLAGEGVGLVATEDIYDVVNNDLSRSGRSINIFKTLM